MPVMEIKILPLGTGSPSVSRALVPALKLLAGFPDVQYQLTAMGTIVEAKDIRRLYEVAALMHEAVLSKVKRAVVFTEIDERRDKAMSARGKLASLERKLGRPTR